jgi:hypothetical protein
VRRFADPSALRAAAWAWWASVSVRRQLRACRLEDVRVPRPPAVPAAADRGVLAVLRRRRDTCLVQARVRQAWHAAHGDPRDLILGVTPPSTGFRAHAWLAGDAEDDAGDYTELSRRPAGA